jgi:hypothetical protein
MSPWSAKTVLDVRGVEPKLIEFYQPSDLKQRLLLLYFERYPAQLGRLLHVLLDAHAPVGITSCFIRPLLYGLFGYNTKASHVASYWLTWDALSLVN